MTRRRRESSGRRVLLLVGICVLLSGVLLGAWLWPADHRAASTAAEAAAMDPDRLAQHGGAARGASRSRVPVGLEIPVIAVATPLVRLGLMPDRTVEVPGDPDLAGWFHRGPQPGRPGSAVILGHVDSVDGPAVFARLRELRAGDDVWIHRDDDSIVRFVVRKSVLYANADFPATRVYAAPGGRRLNLVTCGGRFDSTRGGYQSNLVVYTRLARDGENDS